MPDATKPRTRPTVKLQDSPLAVGGPVPDVPRFPITGTAAALPEQPAGADDAGREQPEDGAANDTPPAEATPPPRRRSSKGTAPQVGRLAAPKLDEPTARLAVDVPESLYDAFARMAEQLRTRGGRRVSQKVLSNREIVAALLWDTLGDASSPEAVDEMDARLRRYRATQHEQAAAAARGED